MSTIANPRSQVTGVLLSLGSIACLFFGSASFAAGQMPAQDITCHDGDGEYSYRFFTGTTVRVAPLRNGEFAERSCTAKLEWSSGEITVAADAAQVAVDVLGVDLGWNEPVVAFQVDKTGNQTDRTYQIYSLRKDPHLLFEIAGGDTYSAADTDLDGRTEIWTDDAAGVDGFEAIPASFFDFAPTVVLRFENKQLVDRSSEFQAHYDEQIAALRAQLIPQELSAFHGSDGMLSAPQPGGADELHRLQRTKMKVLEIVWAFLYSGRAAEAWSALAVMWPPQDFDRIRAAISDARQRGILRAVHSDPRPAQRKHQVRIYDLTGTTWEQRAAPSVQSFEVAPDLPEQKPPFVPPEPILIRRPPPDDANMGTSKPELELLVDAAGKVRSARLLGGTDPALVRASAGWQFVPALRDRVPVACRFRLSIELMR